MEKIAIMSFLLLSCSSLMRTPATQHSKRSIANVQESSREINRAAQQGNMSEVKRLISEGADLNARDLRGYTPLEDVIIYDTEQSFAIVDYLLQKGADPTGNTGDWTPLHYAAFFGRSKIVDRLLQEEGVDINARADAFFHRAPLHLAVEGLGDIKQQNEVIRILLNNGAKTDLRDDKGRTPLEFARQLGRDEIIKFLEFENFLHH